MLPDRECEQPDLWIKCVYLCVHAVSVRIHSSTKICLFADKTCTSSISSQHYIKLWPIHLLIPLFCHFNVPFPASARCILLEFQFYVFGDNGELDQEIGPHQNN